MRKPGKRSPGGGTEGFTLIEMLVSVTLIALISLCVWEVMRITIASWKRGTDSIDTNQQQRATLDLMQKEVASMSSQLPPIDPQTGKGQYPIFVGSGSAMQFLSPCALRFQDIPGMAYVEYDVVSGADGTYSLVEKETRYLGGDPTQAEEFGEGDEPTVSIFEHLSGASFEYFDSGTRDIAPQWVSDWNGLDYMSLPTAVRMTISTQEADGGTKNRWIVIPISSRINNPQINPINPIGIRGRSPNAGNPNTGR
jgi:prepilin-type N-terminal cleavage/methylation domain-containing protein